MPVPLVRNPDPRCVVAHLLGEVVALGVGVPKWYDAGMH
jgi:hypothetical protein